MGSEDLYKAGFVGHGVEGVPGAVLLRSGGGGQGLLPAKYVHQRLAMLMILACSSAVPGRKQTDFDPSTTGGRTDISEWEVNVSPLGRFVGYTGDVAFLRFNEEGYRKVVPGGADYIPRFRQ